MKTKHFNLLRKKFKQNEIDDVKIVLGIRESSKSIISYYKQIVKWNQGRFARMHHRDAVVDLMNEIPGCNIPLLVNKLKLQLPIAAFSFFVVPSRGSESTILERFLNAAKVEIAFDAAVTRDEDDRNVSPSDLVCLALRKINLVTPQLNRQIQVDPTERIVALDLRASVLKAASEIFEEGDRKRYLSVPLGARSLIEARNDETIDFLSSHTVGGDMQSLST